MLLSISRRPSRRKLFSSFQWLRQYVITAVTNLLGEADQIAEGSIPAAKFDDIFNSDDQPMYELCLVPLQNAIFKKLKEKPLKAAYKGAFLKFVKTFFSVNIKKATLLES